jgi:hypothetical protein
MATKQLEAISLSIQGSSETKFADVRSILMDLVCGRTDERMA